MDRYWAQEARSALLYGVLLLGALVLIDWRHSGFSGVRLVWWAAIGVLLTIILLPPWVAAVDNSLVARGLFIRRRVCTASLVAVRMVDGVARRLVLSDASGAGWNWTCGSWSPTHCCATTLSRGPGILWSRARCSTACRWWRVWPGVSTVRRAAGPFGRPA
ncbi:hypothetical protein KMT30_35395 [Streptomyces sp. IBSBF 2953]|nr:hypothetical protein [Streptomyces hayashii]